MLDYARRRLEKRNLKNVEYHLCNGRTFPFNDHTFDKIFMVAVIGEVENRADYIGEFYRILKPGGMLSISELGGDPDKISISELKEMTALHKFIFDKKFGGSRNYTVNFKKQNS